LLIAKALLRRIKLYVGTSMMAENSYYAGHDIGIGTYGKPLIRFKGAAKLKIGKYCSFAEGVNIVLGGNHRTDWATTYPFSACEPSARNIAGHPASKGDVVIGNDVWVASDALILSGVTIGDGAVIGARAVVSKDVAPYSLVVGNPARHAKYRFDQATIERLQRLAWWNWSEVEIKRALPLMLSEDLERLFAAYGV
jgi:acetyltransferase-like isoleucine patch superfamily enzyme